MPFDAFKAVTYRHNLVIRQNRIEIQVLFQHLCQRPRVGMQSPPRCFVEKDFASASHYLLGATEPDEQL